MAGGSPEALRRAIAALVSVTVAFASGVAAFWIAPAPGAIAELYGAPALQGPRLLYRVVSTIDPRTIVRDPQSPRESLSARWTAVWPVDRDDEYTLEVAADDRARVTVDGREAIAPSSDAGIQHSSAPLHLSQGLHLLSVEYEQLDGGMFLDASVSEGGGAPKPLPVGSMLAIGDLDRAGAARWTSRALWSLAAAAMVLAAWIVVRARLPARAIGAGLTGIALVSIVLLAGALRLDALISRAGPFDRPGWLRAIDRHARLPLSRLAPDGFHWVRPPDMYRKGDPANYLVFAREMKHFYAAHLREPVFTALTRTVQPLVGHQDVAVGLASALSSWLLVAAVFVLGLMVAGRWVGLLAALAMAVERDVIAWSVEGWRDDTFALVFVVCACVALRLRDRIDMRASLAAGVAAAGALLTRVTSITFIGAAGLALAVAQFRSPQHATPPRRAILGGAAAVIVAVALAAPFYVNCYRQFGNALHSIDIETGFYRAREGGSSDERMGAAAYVVSRFAASPLQLTHTFVTGMTTYPFGNKWLGFDDWLPYLGRAAAVCSLAGLLLLTTSGAGRMLLVVTEASLLPYAFTHDIPGGAEWRLTMHAYPALLVAAALALVRGVELLWSWRDAPRAIASGFRAHRRGLLAGAAAILALVLDGYTWPYVRLSEDLWFSRSYSIVADRSHTLFFSAGWSEPTKAGNVTSRQSEHPNATVWLPIARRQTHRMSLRLDPARVEDDDPRELRVYVNRQLVSTQQMRMTEGRVGAYDVTVPERALHAGLNRLDLLVVRGGAESATGDAGAIRLWYVRLTAR